MPCRWGFFVLPSDAGVQGKLEQHIVQQDHDWLKLRGQCEVGRWPCGQQGEDVELWRGGAWRAEGQEEETEHEGEQPSFTCQVESCFINPISNIVHITERLHQEYWKLCLMNIRVVEKTPTSAALAHFDDFYSSVYKSRCSITNLSSNRR